MSKIAIAQITIADLSDPIVSGLAPSNPVNDMLWLDTSVSPNVLKRYSNGAWMVVNDTSSLVERITSAEQKITDDAIVSTVRTSTQYKNDLSGKVDNSKLEEYSTIKQTSDAITSAVSGVQVGGRNLLQNNYISSEFRSDSTAELEPISSWAENFVNSAEFAKIFEAGVQYTFSFDYEITAVYEDKTYSSSEHALGFLLYSPSNPTGLPDTDLRAWRKTGVGTKGHVSKSFVLNEIISDAKILIYTNRYTNGWWDTVKFSNIKIERGNKATDWTPAPEDTDGKIDTVNNSVSQVQQTADKINWLVASGDSVSNMQMTSEAYTLISENITLTADKINVVADDINLAGNNTVKITSADQITAEAAKNIDLSANESVKVTAAKINAVANDIDLSGNNTVRISSADQIDISALNNLNLSSNGTITSIVGDVNKAQSAADTAKTAADKAQSSVDNLEVGGRNYIRNGNFSDGENHWEQWGSPTTKEVVEVSSKHWLHIAGNADLEFQGVSQVLPFMRNEPLVVSFTAYASAENTALMLLIHQIGLNNDPQICNIYTLGTTPKRYSKMFTSADDATKTTFGLMLGPRKNANDVYITDIKFERGNRVTDWTPAPEDTDGKIDNAQTAADNAQTTANGAQTAADNAQTAADNAQTTANGAKTAADNAQTTADGAQTAADNAQTTANGAKTAADNAQTTANGAKTAADNAQTAADGAQASADNAQNTATAARTATEQLQVSVEGVLEQTVDGVRIGKRINGQTAPNSLFAGPDGIDVCVENRAVSSFRSDYIKLLGMQIRVPEGIGGLIISSFTED